MTDVVKDQSVKIVLVSGGEPLEYLVRTGEILDAQRQAYSQTHVSGGGSTTSVVNGIVTTTSTPVSSSTTHWTEDTLFYKCGDVEYSVEFRNNTVPIRPGNRVSFIFVGHPGDDSHYLTGIYNHTTRRGDSFHSREPIKAPGLIVSLLMAGIAFCLPFLFFKSVIASTLVGVIAAIITGFIVNAVRESSFKGRLQGDVGLIIENLRSGRDILELHQDPAVHKQTTASPLGGLVIAVVIIVAPFGSIYVGSYLWEKYNSWNKHNGVPMHKSQLDSQQPQLMPQPQLKPQSQPQLKPQAHPQKQQQHPIQKGLQGNQKIITWFTSADALRGKIGQKFTYFCPVAGRRSRMVWGTDLYTADSGVCAAAVHAGLITKKKGGTVNLEIRAGAKVYKGSNRNGVTSKSFGNWNSSFVFVAGS